MKRFALLATVALMLSFVVPTVAGTENERLYPLLGHKGNVGAASYSPGLGHIVTAGVDGSLRVWTQSDHRLYRVHNISPDPLTHLSLHPEKPHAAIVTQPRSGSPRLLVWDWESGVQLFEVALEAQPLMLGFSPQGSYIVYTIESLDSVVMLSSQDGSTVNHGIRRTGISSYFTVSNSEETLMVYTPGNGRFSYRSITDGSVLQTVQSQPGLENIQIFPNRRFAAASLNDELVLVDLLRGSLLDRTKVPSIRAIAVDPRTSDIGVVHTQSSRSYFRTWRVEQNRLREHDFLLREPARVPALLLYFEGKALLTFEDGTLGYFFAHSRFPRIMATDRRLAITGIVHTGEQLYLQTEDSFLELSGFGLGSEPSVLGLSLRSLAESSIRLPEHQRYAVQGTRDGTLYLNRTDLPVNTLFTLSKLGDGVVAVEHEFEAGILEHRVVSDRILVRTAANEVLIWNPRTMEIEYRHAAREISSFTYHPRFGLSVGTNSAAGGGRTLVHVNPVTGETVPLETPAFIITDVAFSDLDGSLYALGLEHGRDGMLYTRLDKWSGSGYGQHTTLYRQPGSDGTAQLAAVPNSNRVWALVSSGRLRLWDGVLELGLSAEPEFYSQLGVYGDLVYAIHRSGAVSFYSAATNTRVLTLYLFRDHEWVAITPDNRYLISAGAVPEDYLILVSPSGAHAGSLREFRLPLPTYSE